MVTTNMSKIYSRSSWNAQHRNGVGTRKVGKLRKYLHHTVTAHLPANASVSQEKAQMRVIERIGQQRFGGGISYNFIIFPSGRIYEGASANRVSYHSGAGRNTNGVGICFAGNYDSNKPTKAALNAVVWLLQEGVRRGWWTDPALTEAHRDFKSTACPGRHLYSQFDDINSRGRSGKPAPAPSAPSGGGSSSGGSKRKSNSTIVQEVIDGKWGTGNTRRQRLQAAGYNYNTIQRMVNERLLGSGGGRGSSGKSVATLAQEVIDGKWGNNPQRSQRLRAAGHDANAVQREVNRRLGAGGGSRPARSGKSISQMASVVIRGDHGTGHNARRRSLGVSNSVYQRVRAEVNRRLK